MSGVVVKVVVKGGGSGCVRGISFGRFGSWVLLVLLFKFVVGVVWVLGVVIIFVFCFK